MFRAADLAALDRLVLAPARAVVPMRDVHKGRTESDVIGLRHDVDNNVGSFLTALRIARWEHERGYRATYFLLHTAHYWYVEEDGFAETVAEIASYGHEIGIHANALAVALEHGGDPAEILAVAIARLRGLGHEIVGVAPHGDRVCHQASFVNDEMFAECARPNMGAPDRALTLRGRQLQLQPRPLADFGLDYETYRLPRGRYLSDSGGDWSTPLHELPETPGQLHVLWHPDWWSATL